MAVYFAVEKPTKYFEVLQNGYLDFDTDKGSHWMIKDTISLHNYVSQKDGHADEISGYLNKMIVKSENQY